MMTTFIPAAGDDALAAWLRREAPMNRDRAAAVMSEFDLTGIVLGDPLNVFHALGYWPQIGRTRLGQPPTSFALLSADRTVPAGFVTTRFSFYYTYADGGFTQPIAPYLYLEAGDEGDATPIAPGDANADRRAEPLSPLEVRRRSALDAVRLEHGSFRDAGAALVRAMRDMGLWCGRVAFDHPVIAAVAERHDRPGTMVPGDNILRAIRLIKSPLEIALLRRASAANADAVHAIGADVRAGAGYHDLRQAFAVETARRGNQAVFMTVDRASSDVCDDRIADGQTLFVDGVSHYRNYHGDYARTLFVGEPRPAARRGAEAAAIGWNAVRDRLRPGLRYSDLIAIGREAVRKAGHDTLIGFGPHSVGLMHSDEPGEEHGGFYRKADLTLREGMTLSVDCPVMDTGVGGSAHLEDLMLITADGAEPLHAVGDAVMTV